MQLRHKFFLILTSMTAVPLLILLFGVVDRAESELRAQTEKELHVTLNKMSDEIQLILNNQKAIARGLAHVPAVQHFAAYTVKQSTTTVNSEDYQRLAEDLELFFLNYY